MELYSFCLQFYELFPDMKSRDLYIGGQSYGMRYATELAYMIHQNNWNKIPLVGIYVGGPYFGLLVEESNYDLKQVLRRAAEETAPYS